MLMNNPKSVTDIHARECLIAEGERDYTQWRKRREREGMTQREIAEAAFSAVVRPFKVECRRRPVKRPIAPRQAMARKEEGAIRCAS